MPDPADAKIIAAAEGAMEVLLHNLHGPCGGLPRTAGWGYPEPYTRDLMISGLAALVTGDGRLMESLGGILATLADHLSPHGHVPSLVHDPEDRGASDTTPLFLMVLALYREAIGDAGFCAEAGERALTWMAYQSPSDRVMVGQQPTSDWRDEQRVMGFGLYVNTLVYACLRLNKLDQQASQLRQMMQQFTVTAEARHRHVHDGLSVRKKPYYAFWSYKLFSSERFDLLGNSLAILFGVASPERAREIIAWVETECQAMVDRGDLALGLPPNFFPFVQPGDPEWSRRYELHNQPGMYHNGGIWPFVCGFYIAALVAAGRHRLAREKLAVLAAAVTPARDAELAFGFNEYLRAQTGEPAGHDWQSWSAAMYLYAVACVQETRTPFFDAVRTEN